jgi:hypothetical protein
MSALTYFRGEYNIKGLKKIPSFVVLYPTGFVVCVVEPKEIKVETKRITAELKKQKVGMLKRPKLVQKGLNEYGDKFAELEMDATLLADKRNKAIMYDMVTDAMYQRRPQDVGGGEFNTTIPGRFIVKTASDKIVVYHDYEKGAEIEQTLIQIFGDKLKIK